MNKTVKHVLLLASLSFIFFMLGNNLVPLTNPDEVFYAQTAKEMAARHEWNVPYIFGQPQFEKPILIYWLLRAAFLVFGMTAFAARFFPAVFAAIGVIALYFLAMRGFGDRRAALASALCLMSSGLYLGLGRTVFTDMVFSVLILLALASFFRGYSSGKGKGTAAILFFLFCGLATLAKGPLGLILPLATAALFLAWRRERPSFSGISLLAGVAVFCAVCLPWYIFITGKYGSSFIHEFFYNDHIRRLFFAEHSKNDKWFFYPATMIGLSFPWCFFLAAALWRLFRPRHKLVPLQHLALSWIAVTFIVFEPAHSKLVSYILPVFPALALVCGGYIGGLMRKKSGIAAASTGLFWATWSVLVLLAAVIAIAVHKVKLLEPSPVKTGVFIAVALAWLVVTLFFIVKKRAHAAFYMFVFTVPVFLGFAPVSLEQAGPLFSSKEIADRLREKCPEEEHLLVSKPFARGILYFTGKPLVIFAPGETNYFSPHPVTFLDTEEKIADYLRRSGTACCVVKKKGHAPALEAICRKNGLKYELLLSSGDACLVKVSP